MFIIIWSDTGIVVHAVSETPFPLQNLAYLRSLLIFLALDQLGKGYLQLLNRIFLRIGIAIIALVGIISWLLLYGECIFRIVGFRFWIISAVVKIGACARMATAIASDVRASIVMVRFPSLNVSSDENIPSSNR